MTDNINVYIRKKPIPSYSEDIVSLIGNKLYVKNKKDGITKFSEYKCNCLIDSDKNNLYCYQNYIHFNTFLKSSQKSYLIFSYGQTGSGKTYTISGNKNTYGILQHTIQDMVNNTDIHNIQMSCIEIYNNKIYDLQDNKAELQIYHICNIRTKNKLISNMNQFIQHLSYIESTKQRGKTAINNNSSRSHIIYSF